MLMMKKPVIKQFTNPLESDRLAELNAELESREYQPITLADAYEVCPIYMALSGPNPRVCSNSIDRFIINHPDELTT